MWAPNLVQITSSFQCITNDKHDETEIQQDLRYTSSELRQIRDDIQHDRRYNILNNQVCIRIRELRINKRRKRGKKSGQKRKSKHQQDLSEKKRNIDDHHLIHVKLTPESKSYAHKVKISSVNARSVKDKDILIRSYLIEEDIDICIISETWLKEEHQAWIDANELNNKGYRMSTSHRQGRSGGGLACVCKEQYKVKTKAAGERQSFQYAVWSIRISQTECMNIVGVYHPPPSTVNPSNTVFVNEFAKFLAEDVMQMDNVVLTGDFNMRINNTEDNEAVAFSDMMYALGFDQHVDFQTHIQGNTVDLMFTENQSKLGVLKCSQGPYLSDHCVVTCTTTIKRSDIKQEKVSYRKLRDIDATDFLKDMNLPRIVKVGDNIDDICAVFNEEATKTLDKHAPLKEKIMTTREKKPWYSEEIRQQKRIFRKSERIWKKNGTPEALSALKVERMKYKHMLRKSKTETIQNKVIECAKDSKKLYKLVSELLGFKSENPLPPDRTDKELSEDFADFFMSKIAKIRDALNDHPCYIPSETEDIPTLENFKELSEDEVRTIIASMATKSCELDPLPTNILKAGIDIILPVVTKIVNVSLKTGEFADIWKTAIIRPLLKKINLDLIPSNYRPVSNLSFLSKVVEKAALLRFTSHCEEHRLMPDYQSAYRTNYSCETAVTKLTNDLLWSMEKQEVSALAAIDLSAAFDTVDHSILLSVLQKKFGISGTCLNWFRSYLTNRKCSVNIGSEYSTARDLNFSVPQGSCAGPVLYLSYASTMQETIPASISLYGYADDHAIVDHFRADDRVEERQCINNIQSCMTKIKRWMDCNRLKMNDTKTEFIQFGSKRQLQKCSTDSIDVNDAVVEKSSEIKYLGVWFDNTVSFKSHVSKKCRLAMLNLQRLKLIRPCLTIDACKTLVQGLVISHLDYANAVFAGLPQCELKKLQRVQNIAAKLILRKKKYDSASACRKDLHWLPIPARIDFKIILLVFKCLTNKAPAVPHQLEDHQSRWFEIMQGH